MEFKRLADAFVASRNWDSATLTRLAFWVEAFGSADALDIGVDEVDAAIVRLAERGRMFGGKRATERSGQPLKGSTINRYASTLAGVYKFARRARLLPRNHVAPTRGIEKLPEPIDPDRYLRLEEAERILACARVVDRKWKRLPALIVLALHTGLRKGNLQKLRWEQVDLAERRVVLGRTKNGEPIGCALTERCVDELSKLTGREPQSLVFGNRTGKPYHFARVWERSCTIAGLPGRNFHQLRHGCGSALALAGVSQAQIMAVMGHKTLTASRRYMHLNTDDQREVVDKVFR